MSFLKSPSSTSIIVESSSKGFITEFPGLYTVVTMVTVQKRDREPVLTIVAAGFSSFLEEFR